jgi:hypothetical protein
MIASMYHLDHRLNELRPSERDHEVARQLRDAASSPRAVVHAPSAPASQWLRSVRIGGQSRLAAG